MHRTTKSIVLIDDDKWLVDLYGEKLRLEGFMIFTAHSGQEGLEMAMKLKPDLVLCDVVMAGGDGFYVLSKLKENEGTKHIPVISLTNLSNEQDRQTLISLGTSAYLVKAEYTPTQVVEKIRKILSQTDLQVAEPHSIDEKIRAKRSVH